MIALIQQARPMARDAREAAGDRFHDGRLCGISWEGQPLIVPEPGRLTWLRHRVTGKRPLPGIGGGGPGLGLGENSTLAVVPTAAAAASPLESRGGFIWAAVDAQAHAGQIANLASVEFGTEVSLSSKAHVFGDTALNVGDNGVLYLSRQVPIVDAQSIMDKVRRGFGTMTPRGDQPVTFGLDDELGSSGGFKLPDGTEDLRKL